MSWFKCFRFSHWFLNNGDNFFALNLSGRIRFVHCIDWRTFKAYVSMVQHSSFIIYFIIYSLHIKGQDIQYGAWKLALTINTVLVFQCICYISPLLYEKVPEDTRINSPEFDLVHQRNNVFLLCTLVFTRDCFNKIINENKFYSSDRKKPQFNRDLILPNLFHSKELFDLH